MSSIAGIEAPVIPVEVGKEAVETTTAAVEVKDGEALTEEMLYPDRAILTSRSTSDVAYDSVSWTGRDQANPTVMGRRIRRGTRTSLVVPSPRLDQA